jgi:hypothetical protein
MKKHHANPQRHTDNLGKKTNNDISSSPPKEMRLSIQHPIIQTPLIRLIEEQVEILERLRDPERL